MIFKWFLIHQWKEMKRSTIWQKNMAMNLVLGFFILLMLMYLLMLGLGIVWWIVRLVVIFSLVVLAFLIASLPSIVVGGLIAWLASAPIAGGIIGGVIFILVMIVVIGLPKLVLSTFATVYHSTAWTLTYRELRAIDIGEQKVESGDLESEFVEVKVETLESVEDAE